MLKLIEIRDAYERSSGKLSEISRQLCFAGFAVVWIFNKSNDGIAIPKDLYWPMLLWCISLMIDVVQYVYKTIAWYIIYLLHKTSNTPEDETTVNEREDVNILTWALFWLKVIAMGWGYILMIKFIITQIS